MEFLNKFKNISVIDAMMFDFPKYMSTYLIEGNKLAMIDTGLPNQTEAVVSAIEKHGYAVSDISYIFVTHCEHPDHAGNVAPLLEIAPEAKVYINPVGLQWLLEPEIEAEARARALSAKMAARFGVQKPVPRERIEFLNDGDIIDLGNDVKLETMFTSAHQPSGYVLLDRKNNGIFISDLAGNYFADTDFCLSLHPPRSDFFQEIVDLKKILELPIEVSYHGHYGIVDHPKDHIARTLEKMQYMIDTGKRCVEKGTPEEIAPIIDTMNRKEAEKLISLRGRDLYDYSINELIPPQAKNFSELFIRWYKNNKEN